MVIKEIAMDITAAEFKAKCLKLMDEVAKTKQPITITKRGKPIAQLVPTTTHKPPAFGCMKGTVLFEGDIVSPLDEEWSAVSGEEDELYASHAPEHKESA
jgi:prevent-host-death family protein